MTQMNEQNETLVRYPVPLGPQRFAYLALPNNLTSADVDRLCRFLRTLVEG